MIHKYILIIIISYQLFNSSILINFGLFKVQFALGFFFSIILVYSYLLFLEADMRLGSGLEADCRRLGTQRHS